jgi:hypothetical protein
VSQVIEVNLRIPQVKEPLKDENGWPINNATIRFTVRVEVPQVPKVGEVISLATTSGSFDASVTQTEWNDEKELFIVNCRYAQRTMPHDEYVALMNDPQWNRKPLLA